MCFGIFSAPGLRMLLLFVVGVGSVFAFARFCKDEISDWFGQSYSIGVLLLFLLHDASKRLVGFENHVVDVVGGQAPTKQRTPSKKETTRRTRRDDTNSPCTVCCNHCTRGRHFFLWQRIVVASSRSLGHGRLCAATTRYSIANRTQLRDDNINKQQ